MSPHRWFLSLLVPALLSMAGVSWAQPVQQQYVVIYVEFQPEEANHGKKLVDDLAIRSLMSPGVINFSATREIARPNRFTLIERWSEPAGVPGLQGLVDVDDVCRQRGTSAGGPAR